MELLRDVKYWVQDLRFADVVVVLVMGVVELAWVCGIVASLREIVVN